MPMSSPAAHRRGFLKAAAGLVIAVHLPLRANAQSGAAKVLGADGGPSTFAPNAFLRIGSDSTVTVLSKHIEMGQGPYTGLTTLVAEELDADWAQMRATSAPSDPTLYNNLAFGPMQGTGGSTAMANSYEQMRKAGATARALLVQAAANAWKVPPGEITVSKGVLRHAAGKHEGRFGDFAVAAAKLKVPDDVKLKDPASFTLIGKEDVVRRLDAPAKSNGTAMFTIDIHEPGMLTVVVAHPTRFNAKVKTVDDKAARAIPGVVDIKTLPSGVAVYATSMWPALKARAALKITWDEQGTEARSSDALIESYRALARQPGKLVKAHGDVEAALGDAGGQVIEAEYAFPYLAHAPMEPLDGYVKWDGKSAHARFGSQIQTLDHATIAKVLGIAQPAVTIETMLAGGSFGRRAQPTSAFAAELAEAAKAIGPGKSIKLVWTREDDIRGGYYRPLFVHRLQGAVRDGKIVAWSNTVVGQSFLKGSPFEGMIKDGIDSTSVEGSNEIPYEVENFRCDLHTTEVGVPTLWWRSVGHTHTGYAVECFIDELLQAAGKDPVAGRLELMGQQPRLAGALRAVADLAKWSGPMAGDGRARGVAVVESFGSFVAQIAEVSLGEDAPRVHKVWCAVDCGQPINPNIIRAQMESGIGYALGHALFAEIKIEDGRPVPANFDAYRSLRIDEMPAVEVAIVPSSEKPSGVGEPGVPPLGPAVANALARLGRKRPRNLPMVQEVA